MSSSELRRGLLYEYSLKLIKQNIEINKKSRYWSAIQPHAHSFQFLKVFKSLKVISWSLKKRERGRGSEVGGRGVYIMLFCLFFVISVLWGLSSLSSSSCEEGSEGGEEKEEKRREGGEKERKGRGGRRDWKKGERARIGRGGTREGTGRVYKLFLLSGFFFFNIFNVLQGMGQKSAMCRGLICLHSRVARAVSSGDLNVYLRR